MENSKHTPGPWAFTDAMYGIDNMRVNGVIDAAGNGVANCGFDYGNRGESIANAQLIAAAPDMLAALHYAARFVEASFCGASAAEIERLGDMTRAAIAKAEGRA